MLRLFKNLSIATRIFAILFAITAIGFAQGNGDYFGFQGLTRPNNISVSGVAAGNTFTSHRGDLNALYYNPAGLVGMEKFQLMFSAKSANRLQQENQVWFESRLHPLLPAIMDGRFTVSQDTAVHVDTIVFYMQAEEYGIPVTGHDPYSAEAANWHEENSSMPFGGISAAMPFSFIGRNATVAVGFNQAYNIYDYDYNATELDPHFGDRTDARIFESPDSLVMNWYRYERLRTGAINDFTAALAIQVGKSSSIGFALHTLFGKTTDELSHTKYAEIMFPTASEFVFSYSDNNENDAKRPQSITGESQFAALYFTLGLNVGLDHFNLGLTLNSPYTIKRDWDYDISGSNNTLLTNGSDELSLPMSGNLGLTLKPSEKLAISFDLGINPLSQAKFTSADTTIQNDTTTTVWGDVRTMGVGFQFQASEALSFRAGYQSLPEVFIPNRAAFRNEGPEAESFTAGVGLKIFIGQLDVAYEYKRLKYFDTWETNMNYVLQAERNIYFGYSIGF